MPNTPIILQAEGDIYPSRFVKFGAGDFLGAQAGANDRIVGISQRGTKYPPLTGLVTNVKAAEVGDQVQLYGPGDQDVLLELGDTVTRGQLLKADADGKGVPIAADGTVLQQYGARALESGSAGHLIQVEVIIGSERPALT